MTNITIYCVDHREKAAFAFEVVINSAKRISYLKQLIKETRPEIYAHVNAIQLELWKVNIPDNACIQMLNLREDGVNGFELMLPTRIIDRYFPDEPAEEHIHVIIECPPGNSLLCFARAWVT